MSPKKSKPDAKIADYRNIVFVAVLRLRQGNYFFEIANSNKGEHHG